jgi:hypothetical protein
MGGVYVDTSENSQSFELNGYDVKVNLDIPQLAPVGGEVAGLASSSRKPTSAGGIVFATGPDEFLVVGKDFRLTFTPLTKDAQKPKVDVEYSDEGSFVNGKWVRTRRLNGDEGRGGGDYGFGLVQTKPGISRFQNPRDADVVLFHLRCTVLDRFFIFWGPSSNYY